MTSLQREGRAWASVVAAVVATLLVSASAHGKDADLRQAIADLSSQANDKQRMDVHGAAKIELNQLRGWLAEASNAVKEKDEKKCRLVLTRVRAQLVLIDQMVLLAQIEDKGKRVAAALAEVKRSAGQATRELQDREAKVRAMKMTQD